MTRDVFKLTDPELQTLVGDYQDLHQVWKLLMADGVVNKDGLVEETKFGKGLAELSEELTEEQGQSVAEAINTFIQAE